jgi:peptide-methionine (S)-S-oxide reductase
MIARVAALVGLAWTIAMAGCAPGPLATAPAAPATEASRETVKMKTDTATFGAGCFWGVEAEFAREPGVVATAVGYCGGSTENPTYKEVCTDRTGHAEVVQIQFDPTKVSYEKLVDVFFELHDPTTLNRQGPDVGTQYRSVIFYHTPEQEQIARAVMDRLAKSGEFSSPIVTQIVPAPPFYRAEEYHQQYFKKHGMETCHIRRPKTKK